MLPRCKNFNNNAGYKKMSVIKRRVDGWLFYPIFISSLFAIDFAA